MVIEIRFHAALEQYYNNTITFKFFCDRKRQKYLNSAYSL